MSKRLDIAEVGLAVAAIVMAFLLGYQLHSHAAQTPAVTPDVPPAGWTVACSPAAIGDVCQTYPPGDRRWEPTAPLPAHLPMRPLPTN